VTVTVWWSAPGLIYHSFLNLGEMITVQIYWHQIDEIHLKLWKYHPALVNRKGPILLHDKTRPLVAQLILQKVYQFGYEIFSHPPYSPDLSPTDYYVFKNLDNFLTNKHFRNQVDSKNAFNDFITSRTPEFYVTGINKLVSRWSMCIESNGFY